MEDQELQENQEFDSEQLESEQVTDEVSEPEEEQPELTPEQKKAKTKKLVTVIAYSVALLYMLAGLFVPLFRFENIVGFEDIATTSLLDRMFLKYVPGVFNALLFPLAKKDIIPLPENGFLFTLKVAGETAKFSTQMLALTVYVITCVLGLIMLIPILFGDSSKRGYAVCAYVVEVLAALSVGYFVFFNLHNPTIAWGASYSFIIVLAGVLLAMAVQSICNKGSLGVSKIVLLVLSVLVFIFLVNVRVFPESVRKVFNSVSKAFGCGESAAFSQTLEEGIGGLGFVAALKSGAELGITQKIFFVVAGLLTCLCLFNLAFDTLEIVTNSKHDKDGVICRNVVMNICAIARYLVALLLAIVSIVLLFIIKDTKPGLYLYLVTAVVLIQLIIAIVRAAVIASKYKKATQEETDEDEDEETDIDPEYSDELQLNDAEYEEDGEDVIAIKNHVYEDENSTDKTDEQQPEQPQQPYYQQPYYQAYEEPEYDDEEEDEEADYEDEEDEYEDEHE